MYVGLKPSDIIHFFNDQVVPQANSIKQYFSSHVPRVTVSFSLFENLYKLQICNVIGISG